MRYLKALFLCLGLLLAVSPAWAAPAPDGSIVSFADVVVPQGTRTESVIVVGGNVTIAGTVTDEVVVLNGDVTLASTANIHDRVVVLGGNLYTENGAYVGKGVFRIGGDFAMASTLVGAGFLILLLWFINIAITAGLVIIPVALAWGFRTKVREMGDIIRSNTIRTILVGLLVSLAVVIAALILTLTVIGIPVAILLALLAMLVCIYGLGGVCYEVGRCLPRGGSAGEREILTCTLYGAVLLALVYNVPLIGLIALKLCLITGFGAAVVKVFTQKERTE